MLIQTTPPLHLTYCLNVHPAESWPATFDVIRTCATAVRDRVADIEDENGDWLRSRAKVPVPAFDMSPFGLGLRISNAASLELTGDELTRLRDYLAGENLYAFTINGFPYGQFHDTAVKADVYAPDWRTDARREYTCRLADILAALLPEGVSGSISTVPVSYGEWMRSAEDRAAAARQLSRTAEHLRQLADRTGRQIILALEPEPDCTVGTTDEAIAFCEETLFRNGDEDLLRQYVGVCVDTAHCGVEFEQPAEAIRKLQRAGIVVGKVQLSAALEAGGDPQSLARVAEFDEAVYLHQVRVRTADGELLHFPDLGGALASPQARRSDCTWRVHFHVPLFWSGDEQLRSTQPLLDADLASLLTGGACPHVEIETYTFGVLPPAVWGGEIVDGIAKEYAWTQRWLQIAG